MSEIVWEDPPEPKNGHKGVWVERLGPLTKRPGKWARVQERKSSSAAYSAATLIKTGRNGKARMRRPLGQWEACVRSVDGKFYVYARYLGPEKKGRGK